MEPSLTTVQEYFDYVAQCSPFDKQCPTSMNLPKQISKEIQELSKDNDNDNDNEVPDTPTNYFCNYQKSYQENRKLFERNFPGVYQETQLWSEPQPSRSCQRKRLQESSICSVTANPSYVTPGSGTFCGRKDSVNIESDLTNRTRVHSQCPETRYIPQQIKNSPSETYSSQFSPMVPLNYMKNSEAVTVPITDSSCHGTFTMYSNIPQQCDSNRYYHKQLSVGPMRKLHNTESIWNNLTRPQTLCQLPLH